MVVTSVVMENFRCFANRKIDLQSSFVVLQGNNGSGKTSIIESLHYACYLRSFRTRALRDLIFNDASHCRVGVEFYQPKWGLKEKITTAFGRDAKKIIRLNEVPIGGYKELIEHYRAVTLTAEDLSLISGEPDGRRHFMNAALLLENSDFISIFSEYKKTLALRNAYLAKIGQRDRSLNEEIKAWTKLLWEQSFRIKNLRTDYLSKVESSLNKLLIEQTSLRYRISFLYAEKKKYYESFEFFWGHHYKENSLLNDELDWQRSLFGAHLDDVHIFLDDKKARLFASRGQQKLLAYLIKITQVQESIKQGSPAVFLVDDFLTDFDQERAQECLQIVQNLATQVILTIPIEYSKIFESDKAQIIHV